jgi:hypothetical protein
MALNAIWKSKSLPKIKVFLWLLMINRLNTRDLMLRNIGMWGLDQNALICFLKQRTIYFLSVRVP